MMFDEKQALKRYSIWASRWKCVIMGKRHCFLAGRVYDLGSVDLGVVACGSFKTFAV